MSGEKEKIAKGQGQATEVFKSVVISNDKLIEGEKRLGPCKVDGLLVSKDGKSNAESFHRAKVLDLLGCYHHACPECYPDRLEVNKMIKFSMGDLYLVSLEKKFLGSKNKKNSKQLLRHQTI